MSEETLTAKEKLQEILRDKDKPLTHAEISSALQGSDSMRKEEEKTIYISMKPTTRPEVVFTGFWSGKFIKAAMDSIAKAYRTRRFKQVRPQPSIPNAVENNTTVTGTVENKEA